MTDEPALLFGRRPVLELLRAGGSIERLLVVQDLKPSGVLAEIDKRAREASIPVKRVPRREVDKLVGDQNHQGIVAMTSPFRYVDLGQLLGRVDPVLLFLDGLTDPHNLGSLLRTADAAGVTGAVVPLRRSVSVTPAVRKVSAGAAERVPVARVANLGRALDEARTAGMWLVGLDEKAEEDLWGSTMLEPPVGLVLGAEDRGISQNIARRCDAFVRIPQVGKIPSLNVAVAGAVVMYEIARRRAASANL